MNDFDDESVGKAYDFFSNARNGVMLDTDLVVAVGALDLYGAVRDANGVEAFVRIGPRSRPGVSTTYVVSVESGSVRRKPLWSG